MRISGRSAGSRWWPVVLLIMCAQRQNMSWRSFPVFRWISIWLRNSAIGIPILSENTLVVIVSQSGETADSLAALREAKKRGFPVLGIVNVVGSSIAREADSVFYTWAGPEISVATTKAYSTQLAAVYLIGILFGEVRECITREEADHYIKELLKLPEKIQRILDEKERIQWLANKFSHTKDVFFIGRGLDYAISMEGFP